MVDVIIIGAGPAGLAAAVYVMRAGKKALVFESDVYGGQIVNTPEVDNYPGIKKISGYEFATELFEQATGLGAEVKYEKVTAISGQGRIKKVTTTKNEYECLAVIIATGVRHRKLGVSNEEEFEGAGISYCATCDGAFFKGADVAVVGGGSTALTDAKYLSNICNKVYLIHRRQGFRGEPGKLEELKKRPNVEFVLDSVVTGISGNGVLESCEIVNKITNDKKLLNISGLFIAVGSDPCNSDILGACGLDEQGYALGGEDCRTDVEGVFAAGDCRTKNVRQLTTAVADGAVAALGACEYIRD